MMYPSFIVFLGTNQEAKTPQNSGKSQQYMAVRCSVISFYLLVYQPSSHKKNLKYLNLSTKNQTVYC